MKRLYLFITIFISFVATSTMAFSSEQKFSTKMPYSSKYITVNGSKMHYVEGGETTGNVFLFLHGNPSSSYLWRNVMPYIEPLGRVIAVDLVGFGKSDKPEIDYTFQDHSLYVNEFISAMKLKNITLVIHDWGSVLGLEYARTHSSNVKAIAMMEAIVPPRFPVSTYESFGPAAGMLKNLRDPKIGRKMIIEQNMLIERILNQGASTRKLSEIEKNAYRSPFLDLKDRKPIYIWPSELPIEGKPARNVEVITKIGGWLKKSDIPKLLLYASPGAIVSPTEANWMQKNYRNFESVYIGQGWHYVQEDQPESIGRNIYSWYQRIF